MGKRGFGKMKVKDIVKEINLFGCMYDFKQVSFEAFLKINGFEIVNDDYVNFEYSDCHAYLYLEVKRV